MISTDTTMKILYITPERFTVVHREISDGSEPALRFYILVAVSTLIASFGLIANSTAVVIGAMLVAPLMTPIFGISLALVRGEPLLLGRAARAEVIGMVAAVSMGFVLGFLLGDIEPTAEMLSRTRPNLFDLFVAVLAGFAGAYALVDEKISPALPGVAIATAIVPPLANAGLCLSLGEVSGGIGSFLLFFANFLSILIVASVTFVLSGMARHYGAQATKTDYVRRFGLPFVAFVLISIFLAHSLVQIYQERRIIKTIRTTLTDDLSNLPATYLGQVHHYAEAGRIQVMATVHTPIYLTPTQVSRVQGRLSAKIGTPIELILHCILRNNISAQGAVKNVITPKLDGTFVSSSENPTINHIATAEQIIREYLSHDRALMLMRVEPLAFAGRKIMLANVLGARELAIKEIAELERRLRKATGEADYELVFSSVRKTLSDTCGTIRYGWIPGDKGTPEIRDRIQKIRADLIGAFAGDTHFSLVNVNATQLDGKLHFLLEIVGPEVYPRSSVAALQDRLAEKYSHPLALYAWSRIDVVHAPQGTVSFAQIQRYFSDRQKENLSEEFSMILEASGR